MSAIPLLPCARFCLLSPMLAGSLLLASAQAADLGDMRVRSAVNEPLSATLGVTNVDMMKTAPVITVAPAEVFERFHEAYGREQSGLSISTISTFPYIVAIQGLHPVEKPFTLILQIQDPGERPAYFRYRVVPVNATDNAPAAKPAVPPAPALYPQKPKSAPLTQKAPAPKVSAAPRKAPAPRPGEAKKAAAPRQAPAAHPETRTKPAPKSTAASPAKPGQSKNKPQLRITRYKIAPGDTMLTIGRKFQQQLYPKATRSQVIVAINNRNPGCFQNKSWSRPIVGCVLVMPQAKSVTAIDRKKASAIIEKRLTPPKR